MVYVKIIILILFVCVKMVMVDICVKSMIIVKKIYVKIMEYVYLILMVMSVVV